MEVEGLHILQLGPLSLRQFTQRWDALTLEGEVLTSGTSATDGPWFCHKGAACLGGTATMSGVIDIQVLPAVQASFKP